MQASRPPNCCSTVEHAMLAVAYVSGCFMDQHRVAWIDVDAAEFYMRMQCFRQMCKVDGALHVD